MITLALYVIACGAPSGPLVTDTATGLAGPTTSLTHPSTTSSSTTPSGARPMDTSTRATPQTGTDTAVRADTAVAADTAVVIDTAPLILNGTYPPRPLPPPEFSARNRDGSARSQGDLIGFPTVLWFYPLTGTPG